MQGVTVCIASGDTGSNSKISDGKAHVQYPGSDPWVLSVGGTTLGNINGSSFDEYVWNDNWGATGGGVSDFFALPSCQSGAGVPVSVNDHHTGRGVPDVGGNALPTAGTAACI
jgi:kumamolisin